MAEYGGTGGKDGDWDSVMDNLVAIMSSDKGHIETIIATHAILVKQNKAKYATIARMASENANLVLIITKRSGFFGRNGRRWQKWRLRATWILVHKCDREKDVTLLAKRDGLTEQVDTPSPGPRSVQAH